MSCSIILHLHMSPLKQSASPSDTTVPGTHSTGVACAQGHDQVCIFDVCVGGLNSDSKLAQQALLPLSICPAPPQPSSHSVGILTDCQEALDMKCA